MAYPVSNGSFGIWDFYGSIYWVPLERARAIVFAKIPREIHGSHVSTQLPQRNVAGLVRAVVHAQGQVFFIGDKMAEAQKKCERCESCHCARNSLKRMRLWQRELEPVNQVTQTMTHSGVQECFADLERMKQHMFLTYVSSETWFIPSSAHRRLHVLIYEMLAPRCQGTHSDTPKGCHGWGLPTCSWKSW